MLTRTHARDELPKDTDPDALARVMIALFQGFALQLAWEPALDPGPLITAVENLFAAMMKRG
ncbi:MAG TPA: hypothetical protein VHX61_16195 [Rhizomicrobium sp.]|nr:hypothetical protein [Rhizomicrobium sp.]